MRHYEDDFEFILLHGSYYSFIHKSDWPIFLVSQLSSFETCDLFLQLLCLVLLQSRCASSQARTKTCSNSSATMLWLGQGDCTLQYCTIASTSLYKASIFPWMPSEFFFDWHQMGQKPDSLTKTVNLGFDS